jgi:molybdopterin-guanine dinucleotide biosynthesis protein
MLVTPPRTIHTSVSGRSESLDSVVARVSGDVDITLAEGFRSSDCRKILVGEAVGLATAR